MEEATEEREKRCPVCAREYPQEDNYCGHDGSLLEQQLISAIDGADVQNRLALQD
jgi:hypothetical protein